MSIVQTHYLLHICIKKREQANRFVNCIDGQKDNWVLSPSNKYILIFLNPLTTRSNL